MLTNRARVEQIVADISKKFHQIFNKDAHLIWFGSWVKGDAGVYCDIDLAINHENPLDSLDLTKFKNFLYDFPTLYSIDLVDMNYASKALIDEIGKTGKTI